MLSRGMRCSDLPYEKSSLAFNRMVYGDGRGGRETSGDYHTRAARGMGLGQDGGWEKGPWFGDMH